MLTPGLRINLGVGYKPLFLDEESKSRPSPRFPQMTWGFSTKGIGSRFIPHLSRLQDVWMDMGIAADAADFIP